MARFLFCPFPEPGDVYPTVPVALALRARGHEVAYLTAPKVEPDLRAEGIWCVVAPGGVQRAEICVAETPVASFRRLEQQVEALGRVFDDFQGDVLVDGAFPFAARLLSELRDIPHASVFTGCFPIPTCDPLFPHGPGQPPPVDDRGRSLARLATILQNDRERDEVAAWDEARGSLGLAPSRVHPWRSDASRSLVLMAGSPALEYPRSDLPPQFWFVGPLVWQTSLARMPERIAALTKAEPIVYVSQGATYNLNPIILKLAFAALASEPLRIVATVVRAFDPGEFDPLPSNVLLERFVPFSELVDRVALVITHGGAGAIHAALSRGVPVIVLPFTADQFEIAARCAWAGAGIRLDPWDCTPDELRGAVRTILNAPSYHSKARRIAESYARLGGAALAASLLERLAETRRPVLRPPWAYDPWEEEVA
jgi:MGT family glycosyltransferase